MTLVVATALADTPDALYDAARRAAPHADWIEVRLDGPSGLPWDLRSFFAHPKPCIATVRHADDGGRTHAEDDTRADLLRRALKAGARGIDVEMHSLARDALVKEARDAGAMVVLSRHDLEGTPRAADMLDELREMRRAGADVAKLATRLTTPADAAALVEAALLARAEGLPFALMAVNDPFLRLLAPTLGMRLVYGAVPGAPPATSGQVPADTLRRAHALQAAPPSGPPRVVALLGSPVARSLSPRMQNAAFDAAGVAASYHALDVDAADLLPLARALARSGALGANVTVPHKEAALALCDELDTSARAAGAVNTLVFTQGRIVGHNTDGAGAIDALRDAGVSVAGMECLVLGAGGAARGIAVALRDAGARVTVTNRTLERARALANDIGARWLPWAEREKALPHVALLVNATTLGASDDALPIDATRLTAQVVLDAVYRPGGTPLVQAARARGLLAISGEAMLLHQGARAFRIWTGRDAPIAIMRAALEASP